MPAQAAGGNAVSTLQAWGLAPEPQRGGQFDRSFPWSQNLYSVNEAHFKNKSFRGMQEQVCF